MYVLTPGTVRYMDIYRMCEQAEASMWTTGDVDISRDRDDLRKLTSDELHYIQYVLAFFAASDGIVNDNLARNFMVMVKIPEVRQFYGIQIGIESIHAAMYGKLLDAYIEDLAQREYFSKAILNLPSVQRKAEWAIRYITDDSVTFVTKLVAFACVEGIFFPLALPRSTTSRPGACCRAWCRPTSILPATKACTRILLPSCTANMLPTSYRTNRWWPLCGRPWTPRKCL